MTVLARGWATVELDRAAVELAGTLVPGTAFEPAAECVHLGAFCRIGWLAEPTEDGATRIILLEPSTEGPDRTYRRLGMAHARRAKLAFVLTCAFVVVPADGALLPMAAQAAPFGATGPVAALGPARADSPRQRKANVDKQLRQLRHDLALHCLSP